MNQLYNEMRTNTVPDNFLNKFQQFRQNFHGDPKQQVQQLLNSGRVSQQQYNQAVQMAQQFQRLFGGRF